jgi:hypothetical protein
MPVSVLACGAKPTTTGVRGLLNNNVVTTGSPSPTPTAVKEVTRLAGATSPIAGIGKPKNCAFDSDELRARTAAAISGFVDIFFIVNSIFVTLIIIVINLI